jgi:hypothetical protein
LRRNLFFIGTKASLASVLGLMTRFLALTIAAFALAFGACEKHPLPDQTAVTAVPGIDGLSAGHGDAHGKADDHGKKDGHPAVEKKEGAAAPAAAKH